MEIQYREQMSLNALVLLYLTAIDSLLLIVTYINTWTEIIFEIIIALTLTVSSFSKKMFEIKIDLNFHFHSSWRYFKRFYESLFDPHQTVGTTKKCENKTLS